MEFTINDLDEHYFERYFSQFSTVREIREGRVQLEQKINELDAPKDEILDALFMMECVFRVYEDRVGRMF